MEEKEYRCKLDLYVEADSLESAEFKFNEILTMIDAAGFEKQVFEIKEND